MFFYIIRFKPNPAGGHAMAYYKDNNDRVTISYNQMKGVLENHNFLSDKDVISIQECYYGIGNNIPRDEEGDYFTTGRSMLIRQINPEVQTVRVVRKPGFGEELVAFNELPNLVTEHFESPNLDRPYPPPPQNGGRRRRSTRRRRNKRRNRSYRRRR